MGVQIDGQLRLDHWQRHPNGSGWVQSDPRWFEDAPIAFRQLPELRTLHASAMNEYVAVDPGPTPAQLLEAMEVAPDGQEADPDSWDDELLDRWTEDEDFTREILSDIDGTPLWATINGQQVATLGIEETSNLVLVDLAGYSVNKDTQKFIDRWRGDKKTYVDVLDFAYFEICDYAEIEDAELGREVVRREFVSLEGIDLEKVDMAVLGDVIHDAVRVQYR
jgi:hypothetical protein